VALVVCGKSCISCCIFVVSIYLTLVF
jgi:hypothetical protein